MDEASAEAPLALDLRGLKCPLPVLRTRKALAAMAPGRALVVLTTDPMAVIDIPHVVREDGHQLVSVASDRVVTKFHVLARGTI